MVLRQIAIALCRSAIPLLCVAHLAPAHAESSRAVLDVHAAATAALRPAERRALLQLAVTKNFDLRALAQAILRSHWRVAREDEREAFMHVLGETIVDTLLQRLAPRRDAPFRVLKDEDLLGGDVLVTTSLTLGPDRLIVIDWRLRGIGGDRRIVDVVVEGRSMAVSRREELARELGGNTNSLSAITAALAARRAAPR